MRGKFIVFDGIDGCGKTTQMLKLIEFLALKDKYKKYSVVSTREPTYDSKAGIFLRKKLAAGGDPKKEGKLFCKLMIKDRAEHCAKLIEPALKYGCIVLCDRYSYSTFAFQQTQGISFDEIIAEHRRHKILKPDLVFIFDLPGQMAFKRICTSRNKSKHTLFEKAKFLEIVRQHYLRLKKLLSENIVIIDATKPIEKVFKQVEAATKKILEQ